MSYGANKWAKPAGRARPAAKSKKSSTRTARARRAGSARAAPKRTKKKAAPKKRSSRSTATRKRAAPKKKKATRKTIAFYDVNTGKKVSVAKADYDAALADPELTTKKPRMVQRYNPETGRKVKVPETSLEAAEWSSKKPPKGSAGLLLRGYQVGGQKGAELVASKITEKVLRSSSSKINKALAKYGGAAASAVSTAAATAGIPTSAAAAALIAAGLISYGLASQAFYPQATDALKLDAALKNYLALKRNLATRLGRPLTAPELKRIYQAYQETVVKIKAHDPFINQRPGRE